MTNFSKGHFEGILIKFHDVPGIPDRRIVQFRPTDVVTRPEDWNVPVLPEDQFVVVEKERIVPVAKGQRPQYFLFPKDIEDLSKAFGNETVEAGLKWAVASMNADSSIRSIEKVHAERVVASAQRQGKGELSKKEVDRLVELQNIGTQALAAALSAKAQKKKNKGGNESEN